MRLVLFIPWATIGASGWDARNSFHTDGYLPGNSAFNTIVIGFSGCVSSEGWHVQQEKGLPGQKSEAP